MDIQFLKNTSYQEKFLLILGAGAYAEEIAEMASAVPGCQVIGFVEGIDQEKCKNPLLDKPIYWIDEVYQFKDSVQAICAVGSPDRKFFISQAERQGLQFTSLIHPSAIISPSVLIGQGTIIGPGTTIGSQSSVGSHVILTRGCMIGHHVQIGNFVTITAGVNIGGKTTICDGCFIGMGANILDHLVIGSDSVVSAGSLVNHDVPPGVQAVGMPARVVKLIKDTLET